MQYCVDHPQEISKLSKVKAHVSEVKGVLDRGEKIEFPVDKTENLRSQVRETFRVTEFIDKMVSDVEPMKPPPVESTFKLVQDVKDLKELTVKLCDANEFAVDLEHNHYRSFQGLTCWCKYLPERKILS
ncbi:putative ribonuclease H-like superfamily [Helianthus annuus]|uniref:Ribonuclease H-like superfamily n=1 Tax=Helianthus annuus TaxID=4232 RepID=A0A9K3JWF4_HELAN|nr:putative ribonuclease H-like superfamily [Helianthus annuus]KAJ0957654.1 putative ribonuclease H-like superfamily [Helianthus annuus]